LSLSRTNINTARVSDSVYEDVRSPWCIYRRFIRRSLWPLEWEPQKHS